MIVFLGPSLPWKEARELAPEARLLPPARQGDLFRALSQTPRPRVVLLVDGVFEASPSVWHRELLAALGEGVTVFGASSMGALRAAELAPFGMIPVGQIARAYAEGRLNDDAEVALLHADHELDFRPMTVPLVNARYAAALARQEKVLAPRESQRLVRAAEQLFYRDRTWSALFAHAGLTEAVAKRFRAWLSPRADLKALDAREALRVARELSTALRQRPDGTGEGAPRASAASASSLARTTRLLAAQGTELKGLAAREESERWRREGLRTLLLAGRARELGVTAPPAELERWRQRLGASGPQAAELLALEAWLLDHARASVNDGPSDVEALWLGALRARLG